jgi:uncharacterized protein YfaS (alpha-2-macroglobulin family)
MASVDTNAVRLLLSVLGTEPWKEDIARIVRGAVGRQHRGHWDTTVANAWGVLAMEKFSDLFEKVPVSGETETGIGADTDTLSWAAYPDGKPVRLAWPEGKGTLAITHEGEGKPWATIQSIAALPLDAPISTGYKIEKTWTPVERKDPAHWTRGDVIRVKLQIEAQADKSWVVVNDPIPTGTSILGGMSTDSQLLAHGEKSTGNAWLAFEERAMEAYRAYFEYAPKGGFSVEYTLRLNQDGQFHLPSTRVEAMYSPEMFGEIPNTTVEVKQ